MGSNAESVHVLELAESKGGAGYASELKKKQVPAKKQKQNQKKD